MFRDVTDTPLHNEPTPGAINRGLGGEIDPLIS